VQSISPTLEEFARVEYALGGAILVVACAAFSPITAAMISRLSPRDALRRLHTPPPWGWKQTLPILTALLLAFFPWPVSSSEAEALPGSVNLEIVVLVTGGLAGLATVLALGSGPGSTRALGLRWEGNGRAVGVGLLAYFVSLPGLLGLMQMTP
jgi:hypothetical protein